jgi:transposase InsO family protein
VGWKETSVVDERLQFIGECKSGEWSMAEVCRRFEISRITGYKWLKRYEEEGLEGLKDRSHAPHHNPRQVAEEVEEAIVEARAAHPYWGPVKLRTWLQRSEPKIQWPAASTVGEILRRHGLAVPRKKRFKAPPNSEPLKEANGPNRIWCADFKGWFRCLDGSRCDPLTISDAYSRFLLRCQGVKHPDSWYVTPLFEAAFREYGLPERIRIDNGAPFASVGIGGLSELSVWWIKLGIRPERIEPGKPAQNGRHERLHRTLKQETAQPPRANLREQQRAFDMFRHEYNYERPHQALQGRTPAECYQSSPRLYRGRVREVTYPSEYEVRYVSEGGQIRWNGGRVFVGRALLGEPLGLELIADGKWRVWFSFYELGIFDEEKLLIRPKPVESPSTKR